MKKILIILLLLPCFLKAQVDTIGIVSRCYKAGTFNIDTLKIQNNSTVQLLLSLQGSTAKAVKIVIISNINNKYKIVSNLNPVTFSGLAGGKFEVLLVNNIVVAKITGTKTVIQWKLITIYL